MELILFVTVTKVARAKSFLDTEARRSAEHMWPKLETKNPHEKNPSFTQKTHNILYIHLLATRLPSSRNLS